MGVKDFGLGGLRPIQTGKSRPYCRFSARAAFSGLCVLVSFFGDSPLRLLANF
jgi:hypothetical protein